MHSRTNGRGTEPLKGFCHSQAFFSALYQASARGAWSDGEGERGGAGQQEGSCQQACMPVVTSLRHALLVMHVFPSLVKLDLQGFWNVSGLG